MSGARGPVVSFNSNSLCKGYYCRYLQMTKPRLGEARSHRCSSPSGKLYPHFTPLLPQAGRAREEVKGLWWDLFTHGPLVPRLFCTLWLGPVSRDPLGTVSLPSVTHPAEVGLEDLVGLSGHAPVRRRGGPADQPIFQAQKLSVVCLLGGSQETLVFAGAPCPTKLTSCRVKS